MMDRKARGAFYTPDAVAETLVRWVVKQPEDRLLDPSCGDGCFVSIHPNSMGVEREFSEAHRAKQRAPNAEIIQDDFFCWVGETANRFDCVAGNPPFIRYQKFKGETRTKAIEYCSKIGAKFSGLTSSWAPFLVAAASLLKPNGRMAFVVPAEIGHAPYAIPLVEFLIEHFSKIHLVAYRQKIFPELSEDCWLLYCGGYGGKSNGVRFSTRERFSETSTPPRDFEQIDVDELRDRWKFRLRPFILEKSMREFYREIADSLESRRFSEIAAVSLGYVSGANDFFHLRPSEAERLDIPRNFLTPTVRNGRVLPPRTLTDQTVKAWRISDEPILLLRLPKSNEIPTTIERYLDSENGLVARQAYKCRTREPWYSVPDVQVPDFFLTYMTSGAPSLVYNSAKCTCTNSVHGVKIRNRNDTSTIANQWNHPFIRLSCEIEGHPLGGGLLKLELKEAANIVIPSIEMLNLIDQDMANEAILRLRSWRHHARE